jgi:hypothetical protein
MSETIDAAAPDAGTAETDVTLPVDTAAETDTADTTEQDGDTEGQAKAAPEEEIEIAFGAKALKVAKGAIPDEVLAELTEFTKGVQGDYTQKTQAVAEARRAVEAEREFLNVASKLSGDKLRDFAEGQMIARDLQALQAQFQQQSASLWQSNPDQARQMSDRISMLQAELNGKVEAVSRHEAEIKRANEEYVARTVEAGRAEMQKRVKGFDASAEKALTEYAASRGIPAEHAGQWAMNPVVAEAFWKAMQFDKQAATVKAAAAAKQNPAAPPAPMKAVATGNRGAVDESQISDEEYFRREMKRAAEARRPRR